MKDLTTELPLALVDDGARQTVSPRGEDGGADQVVWVENDSVKDWRDCGQGGGAGAESQLSPIRVRLPVSVEEDGRCEAVALVARFRYRVSDLHS